jgi:hypothetical protein
MTAETMLEALEAAHIVQEYMMCAMASPNGSPIVPIVETARRLAPPQTRRAAHFRGNAA